MGHVFLKSNSVLNGLKVFPTGFRTHVFTYFLHTFSKCRGKMFRTKAMFVTRRKCIQLEKFVHVPCIRRDKQC